MPLRGLISMKKFEQVRRKKAMKRQKEKQELKELLEKVKEQSKGIR